MWLWLAGTPQAGLRACKRTRKIRVVSSTIITPSPKRECMHLRTYADTLLWHQRHDKVSEPPTTVDCTHCCGLCGLHASLLLYHSHHGELEAAGDRFVLLRGTCSAADADSCGGTVFVIAVALASFHMWSNSGGVGSSDQVK